MNTYYISYVWKYDRKQKFSYTYHKADKMTQDELYIVQEKLNKQHGGGMYFEGIVIIGWNKFEDYDKIKNYCWHYNRSGHLISTEPNSNKRAFLHRKVMEPIPDGMIVDHINHPSRNQPKYDNRKQNLRFVTSRQNTINSTIRSDNTSGVTGVSYNTRTQKWIARINIAPNKRVVIGSYNNFEDAVNARKEAESQYYGEYSYNVNNKGGNQDECVSRNNV